MGKLPRMVRRGCKLDPGSKGLPHPSPVLCQGNPIVHQCKRFSAPWAKDLLHPVLTTFGSFPLPGALPDSLVCNDSLLPSFKPYYFVGHLSAAAPAPSSTRKVSKTKSRRLVRIPTPRVHPSVAAEHTDNFVWAKFPLKPKERRNGSKKRFKKVPCMGVRGRKGS